MKSPTQSLWLLFSILFVSLVAHAGGNSVRNLPGWGQVIDPDGDCIITCTNGNLTVTVPGTTHDLSSYHSIYKKRNAPRVLQEVDGDFTVQVKISGTFQPGKAGTLPEAYPFNGAGLLLWDNNENYLRLERNAWITSHSERFSYLPLFEYWKDDKDLMTNTPINKPFFKGRIAYLRLTRRGEQISAAFSNDGINWVQTNPVTAQFPQKIKVGVDTINTSKQLFTVEFSELKLVAK
jgi:regulation of enolase protein 1 (concanavalin A-like superfamily)